MQNPARSGVVSELFMNIVSSTDDGYVAHYAALMHSVFLYHPDAHLFLFDHGISSANRKTLEDFAEQLGFKQTIYPSKDRLAPLLSRIESEHHKGYPRILISECLPPDVKRVLYLDVDIAVVGRLDELYSIDLGGRCMAARVDPASNFNFESRLTGIDFKDHLFNSGVMMIDLDRWRSEHVSEMVFEYCKERALPVVGDQTALNVVIRDRYVRMGPEWNFFWNSDVETCPRPKIIHYIFDKPWLRRDSVNLDIYQFHRGFTPWPFEPPSNLGFSWIRRRRHKLGARFGIKRMQESVEQFRLQSLVREKIINPAVTAARLAVIGRGQ